MPKVSNLTIDIQSGSSSTYFASWDFKEDIKNDPPGSSGSGSSSSVKVGAYVQIKSGATYYNGVSIPSWVMSDTWQVIELSGDRAVLGRNKSGTNNIESPINVKYLTGVSKIDARADVSILKTLDFYRVTWRYSTGDGIWFDGSSSDIKLKNATYSAPSNSRSIKVYVKPVSKKHKVNGKDTYYWTGTTVSKTYSISQDPPSKLSAPSVEIDKYKLTATVDNISDPKSDEILFEVYDGVKKIKTGVVTVRACIATYSCTVNAGGNYRVRCRAINLVSGKKVYGEWSDFSGGNMTIPATPAKITEIRATSETSIYVAWTAVDTATSYDLEYATDKRYFEGSNETQKITGIEGTSYEKTGLEAGDEYFFRVRAVNDQGASSWSPIASVVIGKDPASPTTWSSTTTVITGEPLYLYWVHNSEDGSSQTYAEVEMTVDGVRNTYTVDTNDNIGTDKENDVNEYPIDTSKYLEGTKIEWRVRTAGATKVYGDWSIMRTVDVYAPPTLEMDITDKEGTSLNIITTFPFYISALAGPKTQIPIGYHVTISADEGYQTTDQIGNPKIVNPGDIVYSQYFDIKAALNVELSASDIDLENNINYTVMCVVSMDSGLTAQATDTFSVSWIDVSYEPDIEISIDEETYSTYVRPYCIDENGATIESVLLSVYRREFDGSFTELAVNIDTGKNEFITDPHPSLDYARYRVVAIDKATGAVSYYDPPGYPIFGTSVIIQWDDVWRRFETTTEDELESPPWSGSILKIPYNIDVSDGNSPDVSLVEYIGREHPVSYYGTQLGVTSTWNMAIPKEDKETIYALRRLAIWMGDVYVREPSGSGYWANIKVTFNQKHCEPAVPITLDITRVSGGV